MTSRRLAYDDALSIEQLVGSCARSGVTLPDVDLLTPFGQTATASQVPRPRMSLQPVDARLVELATHLEQRL